MSEEFGMTGLERMNDIVSEAAKAFGAPSVAASVIYDGDQKDISFGCGKDTLFPAGELSKVFLSDAVRSSGMDIDTPVVERSEWFRIRDAEASRRVTVRDILLQRTGVPEHRVSWFIQPQLSSRSLSEIVRHLESAYGFRESPLRQDHLFTALSRIVEDSTGTSWEDVVKSEVLEKISAKSTYFSWQSLPETERANTAMPFYSSYGSLKEGTRWMTDPLAGGGSMFCCASDLARMAEKKRIDRCTETVTVRERDFFDYPLSLIGAEKAECGDGWFRMEFLGNRIVCGTGSSGGSRVFAGWLEDHPLSFAAAANLDGTNCAQAICLALCELICFGEARDWNGRFRSISDSVLAARRRANSVLLRACNDDVFPSGCTGTYFNEGYGELYFCEEYGRLFLELFGVPMRIYHTEEEICVLDATEVLGRAVPCLVSEAFIGLMLEPKTGKMTEFLRKD